MSKKIIFSGIQATGSLHLGNYLGAISNWVKMQDEYDNYFCVVDLHTITVPQDPEVLKAKVKEVAGLLFAAGLDEEKSVVFIQSYVKAHSELAWIFNCVTPMGWLYRMTQFKDKSETQKDEVSVGLFDYPVLQAADILLYDADLVPVGEDQKQHIELCRDIAQRFNYRFGKTFVMPDAFIPRVGGRVMGLANPEKKMSKSEENINDAIYLLDSADVIKNKVKRATTDSERSIVFDDNRPGVTNLLTIYQLLTGSDKSDIEAHFEGKNYKSLKDELTEAIVESLRPLQERYKKLAGDEGFLDQILAQGAEKAGQRASEKMDLVHKNMGLR